MRAPRSSFFPRRPRQRTAGSVVVLVLVTVLLAAFMLTKFVERAGTELLADARSGDRLRLRREAYSSMEVTLAVLADVRAIDQALYSPAQGWDRPLEYAGYVPAGGLTVEVDFDDESGRISLPRADAATLEGVFALTGVDRDLAERASDALLLWMHPEYVPPTLDTDPGNYDQAALPHHAAGRPLRSLDELASIAVVRDILFDDDGRPNERFRQFAGAVSLLSFSQMNLNSAGPEALAAVGLPAERIGAVQDYRRAAAQGTDARPYLQSPADATALLGATAPTQSFGTQVQALRVIVTVHDGANRYRLSVVIAPPNGATVPARPAAAAPPAGQDATASQKAPVVLKKLDYPFKVLEVVEDMELPDPASAHD